MSRTIDTRTLGHESGRIVECLRRYTALRTGARVHALIEALAFDRRTGRRPLRMECAPGSAARTGGGR